ncbi:MAG: pseudaminic acid biosynthesis-associated methylase [Maricaulaceae bacterium]
MADQSFTTDQEAFWAGAFGDAYVDRSQGADLVAARTALWSQILRRCSPVGSVTEFGANVGLNLMALRRLLPRVALKAVEINPKACAVLETLDGVEAHQGSFLDTAPATPSDLAFTCTVLIHINPERLKEAYAQIYKAASRYVVICEYYNPTPVEVSYRGHAERLFKRDFAGEMMDAHPDLDLLDYGFVYHRDPLFPTDDFTWFLMEKR